VAEQEGVGFDGVVVAELLAERADAVSGDDDAGEVDLYGDLVGGGSGEGVCGEG
jgi:hypothetical protein